MSKERSGNGLSPDAVISIIGPGMKVIGDCETDGTIRIEGAVQGSVRAAKAVVIGRDGLVSGDVVTQDAVISGRVKGTLTAESRLELQATCEIEGEVHTRRMQLEEGAVLNATVHMSTANAGAAAHAKESAEAVAPDPSAVAVQAAAGGSGGH
jgi:cytoskeletal protein CcmA (bactofilin family)